LCERSGFDAIIVETVGVGQSEVEVDNVSDFVVYVVPPASGDGLQGAKKGVMEIADLIVVNKYDSEYKRPCERLKRQIEAAISLTMPKHTYDDYYWIPPVELVSAKQPFNVESIWNHAVKFKQEIGPEKLKDRRNAQIKLGMWRFLGDALMRKLRSDYEEAGNVYERVIREAEAALVAETISGHEAASRIIAAIFDREHQIKK
jgi:LAO/AO transport system kinase